MTVSMQRRCECGHEFTVEVPDETLAKLPPDRYRIKAVCGCGSVNVQVFDTEGMTLGCIETRLAPRRRRHASLCAFIMGKLVA